MGSLRGAGPLCADGAVGVLVLAVLVSLLCCPLLWAGTCSSAALALDSMDGQLFATQLWHRMLLVQSNCISQCSRAWALLCSLHSPMLLWQVQCNHLCFICFLTLPCHGEAEKGCPKGEKGDPTSLPLV